MALRAVTRRPPIGLLSPAQDGAPAARPLRRCSRPARRRSASERAGTWPSLPALCCSVGWTVGGLAVLFLALVVLSGPSRSRSPPRSAQAADIGAGGAHRRGGVLRHHPLRVDLTSPVPVYEQSAVRSPPW